MLDTGRLRARIGTRTVLKDFNLQLTMPRAQQSGRNHSIYSNKHDNSRRTMSLLVMNSCCDYTDNHIPLYLN